MTNDMDLTRHQAHNAIPMCLSNAKEYLEDAKIKYEKRRLQHIRIEFQFALEELGKAKVMMDQMNAGNQTIQMSNAIRKTRQIKVDHIKNLIKVPSAKEKEYEDVWANFPMPFIQMAAKRIAEKFAVLDQDIITDIVTDGHNKRLRTFVNFDDNTCDPYLDGPMREGDCQLMIRVIEEIIKDFTNQASQIRL
jgi:AbiV family abortive infection protein